MLFDTVFRDKIFNALGENDYDYKIKNDKIVINLEVPGVGKDNLSIECDYKSGNILIKKDNKAYKSFYIPNSIPIDFEKAEAELEKGILSLKLPIDREKNEIEIQ